MQLKTVSPKWVLTSLGMKAPFLELEWEPKDQNRTATWNLYVRLITRAVTRSLRVGTEKPHAGDTGYTRSQ